MANSPKHRRSPRARRARLRFAVMLVAGAAAAAAAAPWGSWAAAASAGWTAAALVYNLWIWLVITPMDAASTAAHAQQEDPARPTADLLILLAALASLAGVVLLMLEAAGASGPPGFLLAALAALTTALSWLMVHTLFTLRYAELYYVRETPGGINFNQAEPPQYTDFAYLAFSLGMTYQVSDTSIGSRQMRSAALRHSLLSFVFGTGILAVTINLVVGLAH